MCFFFKKKKSAAIPHDFDNLFNIKKFQQDKDSLLTTVEIKNSDTYAALNDVLNAISININIMRNSIAIHLDATKNGLNILMASSKLYGPTIVCDAKNNVLSLIFVDSDKGFRRVLENIIELALRQGREPSYTTEEIETVTALTESILADLHVKSLNNLAASPVFKH